MRVALVLLGVLTAALALDAVAFGGRYRQAAWDGATRQGAQIEYEIQYWVRRATR